MPYESSFGELAMDGANRAPGGPETPFRILLLADFSGRVAVDDRYQSWEGSPLTVTVQENPPAGAYDLKLKILRR